MNVQFIKTNGKPAFAVLPIAEYQALLDQRETLEDLKAFDTALLDDEESIPLEIVKRLMEGENKLKVWRDYRGLTQQQLSDLTGLSQPTIAQMETKRNGTIANLKKLAVALDIDLDDLAY